MPDHPYGFWSLLPPVAAIVLAIATRRVVPSLLAGIFAGALILNHGNPLFAVGDALESHLWATVTDPGNLRIYSFTILMGAMVSVLSRSGGMRGLVLLVTPWANDRRKGQLATWSSGLLIFFDDYANTILLGNTLRPLCDRLQVTREKLAFIVDSTAAPVAGLSPLSTWVAFEVLLIDQGLSDIGADTIEGSANAFELFLYSIPFRFYPIFMLCFVPLTALMLREFGTMRKAEQLLSETGTSPGMLTTETLSGNSEVPARWYNAVLPIGVTLSVVVWLLWKSGYEGWISQNPDATIVPQLSDILGESDSAYSLSYGALAGLIVAALLIRGQRLLSGSEFREACENGVRVILPALAILICAMTLSSMTKGKPELGSTVAEAYPEQETRLYSGPYLTSLLLGQSVEAITQGEETETLTRRRNTLQWMLPTIIFLLAAVTAFCTGTSFGTIGILMPMTVSLAYSVLGGVADVSATNPILLGAISGVLAGAIFGDHCSPISDTTVLSAQSSGCDHIAHVWTQMPYALAVGLVSILLGTLPLGFGVPVWVLLPAGMVAVFLLIRILGHRVESSARDIQHET